MNDEFPEFEFVAKEYWPQPLSRYEGSKEDPFYLRLRKQAHQLLYSVDGMRVLLPSKAAAKKAQSAIQVINRSNVSKGGASGKLPEGFAVRTAVRASGQGDSYYLYFRIEVTPIRTKKVQNG